METRWSWWARPADPQDPHASGPAAVLVNGDEQAGSRGVRPFLTMAPSPAADAEENGNVIEAPTRLTALERSRDGRGHLATVQQLSASAARPVRDGDGKRTGNDEPRDHARGETARQRLDRRYHELLQEVRVAQTAVQILLAFLLTLSFTPKFATLTDLQQNLYVVTLVLGTATTALLTAPAAFHRVVFRRQMKRQLVRAAHRYTVCGFALLLLAKGCALLLILDVVVGNTVAVRITAAVMMWFVLCWVAVPYWFRLKHREQHPVASVQPSGAPR
jgi:Family of unknown function (DUF6328)